VTETIEPMAAQIDQQRLAEELVAQAHEEGVQLVGPGGMLTGLTKAVVETALEEELSDHLGYDKHDPAGRNGSNSRNGYRAKTVLTEIGPVKIEVPRDRDGSFEPAIVGKRQRRLNGIDEIVLSLARARADHRGGLRALRRGLWRPGLQGHHLPDHRQGDRGDDRVAQPAAAR
jgi:putative transposase